MSLSINQIRKMELKSKNTTEIELQNLKENVSTPNFSDITTKNLEKLSNKKRKMNKTLKTDRNLSITLVTVALTFIVLTMPFQSLWIYEYFFRHTNENQSEVSNKNATLNTTHASMENEDNSETGLKAILLNIKNTLV